MPPVRGTGCACSERSFGVSSASRRPAGVSSRRATSTAARNAASGASASMARILAALRAVPLRREAQAFLQTERRPPAELGADGAIVRLAATARAARSAGTSRSSAGGNGNSRAGRPSARPMARHSSGVDTGAPSLTA